MDSFWLIAGIALVSALASPLGGFLATLVPPSTLFLSTAVGLAGGILIGTLSFEMVPTALESLPMIMVLAGLAVGVALTFGLDLLVNRGRLVGDAADQKQKVERYHRRHRPFGTQVTVLALATATEELIEGLSIGVGGTIGLGTAIALGVAICIDNVSEALSIGALAREEAGEHFRQRTLLWTSLVGVSLFVSAMAGLLLLKDLSKEILAFLLSIGAGAMFYLTITDLIPEAEQHQYQQSAGLAATAGFLIALVLSQI